MPETASHFPSVDVGNIEVAPAEPVNRSQQEAILGTPPAPGKLEQLVHNRYVGGAVVALALGAAISHAPEASAATHKPPKKQPVAAQGHIIKPVRPTTCSPHNGIKLTLQGPNPVTSGQSEKFTLTQSRCKTATGKALKKVRLVESATGSLEPPQTWKLKALKPGVDKHKNIRNIFPADSVDSNQSNTADSTRTIAVRAYNQKGKRIASGKWSLDYKPAPCTPDPNFAVGISDNSQFVWQQKIGRDEAFDLASSTFGASVLRIIMSYDEVMAHGYQPYIDTVNSAAAHGFKVQVTLMPTPAYSPNGDQTLNYVNLDPATMQSFAQKTATTLGPAVVRYSIGNEVNHFAFSADHTIAKYDPMFNAGQAGIEQSSNPNAEVLAGELAPGDHLDDWVESLGSLRADGDAVHPYHEWIYRLGEIVHAAAGRPVYLSEYGNFASDANQMADNLKAIQLAKCYSDIKQLVFYQLVDGVNPGSGWNTGVIRVDNLASR